MPSDTRCPIPDCHQARAQFLDPNFDPLSNAVPRYARYEVTVTDIIKMGAEQTDVATSARTSLSVVRNTVLIR
ncbi:hypothetical protein QC762_0091170 [Podospora pseudocomata]|uniref:Uncharacterized protein n=1 Tax=Podospora pseudocomata TaxID=2093779 RepID=A0ABR0G6K4_9PEZI|nr:hypothetical protein QC762_0091170 [Podospora pseudocomata]